MAVVTNLQGTFRLRDSEITQKDAINHILSVSNTSTPVALNP